MRAQRRAARQVRARDKIHRDVVYARLIFLTGRIGLSMLCGSRRSAGSASDGGVAQLGERVNGIHEVRGSIPLASIRRERRCGLRE